MRVRCCSFKARDKCKMTRRASASRHGILEPKFCPLGQFPLGFRVMPPSAPMVIKAVFWFKIYEWYEDTCTRIQCHSTTLHARHIFSVRLILTACPPRTWESKRWMIIKQATFEKAPCIPHPQSQSHHVAICGY